MPFKQYHGSAGVCSCRDAEMRKIGANSDGYWEICRRCGLPVEDSYVAVSVDAAKIQYPHAKRNLGFDDENIGRYLKE